MQSLLATLDIAAFERTPDGAFRSLAPVPAWFARLVGDSTFPFLGHILEEAVEFWNGGTPGFQEFGPCAEVDDGGVEFHYKVLAVATPEGQYLLFQRDPAADRLREVLQRARDHALDARTDERVKATLATVQGEVRRKGGDITETLRQFIGTSPTPAQVDLLHTMSSLCADLVSRVDGIVRAALPPRDR